MSSLTLNEYQERAVETAVYPSEQLVNYPALSLAGEAGEVAEKVLLNPNDAAGIAKEVGGTLWYCAALARDLGVTLGDIVLDASFDEFQTVIEGLIYDTQPPCPVRTVAALCCKTGHIANQVKKTIRGDATVEQKKDKIVGYLRSTVIGCAYLAYACGFSLGAAAQGNLDELRSRQERGTLMGDGDNR